MTFAIKGQGFEGSGSGLVRKSGSCAINGSNVVIKTRPSKGNFTLTRVATGVYQYVDNQAFVSVVSAGAQVGDATGASTSTLRTGVGCYVWVSQDFMTTNAAFTQYLSDSTQKKMLLLVFNSSNNALADLPSNTRLSFDFTFAQSTENS